MVKLCSEIVLTDFQCARFALRGAGAGAGPCHLLTAHNPNHNNGLQQVPFE